MAPLDMLMSNCFIFSSAISVYIYSSGDIIHTVERQDMITEPIGKFARRRRPHEIRHSCSVSIFSACRSVYRRTPRNTCVRFTIPTGSTRYLPTLSSKLLLKSLALRLGRAPSSEDTVVSVNGSSVPLFRLRPVRLGTVTLSRTLFVWELVDCKGLDMASSGRRTKLALVSALEFII
jgi:hypothetical protein